jgi:hypothetical protein
MLPQDPPYASHGDRSFRMIWHLQRALDAALAAVLSPLNLSIIDHEVMLSIKAHGRLDLNSLGFRLPFAKFDIAQGVDRLIASGLIVPRLEANKFNPPYDLTADGLSVLVKSTAAVVTLEESLVKRVDEKFYDGIATATDAIDTFTEFANFTALRHKLDEASLD